MVSIAIDGPAGSGKSTIARLLAERLGYIYVDTGAMYRSVTLSILQHQIDLTKTDELIALIESLEIDLQGCPSSSCVYLNGQDVTRDIRKEQVSNWVSEVAKISEVRSIMVKKQRKLAQMHDVVMDGRDIGSSVLPHAQFKFFLTATLEERARRRKKDADALQEPIDLLEMKERIRKRDEMDENRAISPLKMADDAIMIDTTDLSVEQILNKMLRIIEKR